MIISVSVVCGVIVITVCIIIIVWIVRKKKNEYKRINTEDDNR